MKKYISEMIGTMVLVLMGSSDLVWDDSPSPDGCFCFWFIGCSDGLCNWWNIRMSY